VNLENPVVGGEIQDEEIEIVGAVEIVNQTPVVELIEASV
jgi:hypothetical protein